jgi:3-dehydroquinate dehydratase/shikimate dehydrogenase
MIHNAAFRALHLNKVYVPFRVPQADLFRFLEDCRDLRIRGLSVTIPHKEAVVSKCTKVEAAVRGIGAVNTMIFDKDDTVLGFNTDYRAAMECLDRLLVGDPPAPPPWQHMIALVLGAGGVAKAIGFGLARRGVKVIVASRTLSRARALAKDIGGQAVDWEGRHIVKAHILVNGTPIGMHPNVDETPYEKNRLRPGMVVFDIVYNPEQTLLVKEARLQRCKVVTGVEMFIRQAAHQFHHFTQKPAPTELMRDQLRRAIGPAKYEH